MREHLNGMYRTDTYYWTRQIAEIPVQILTPILFTSIFYWMVGMNPELSRFFMACLINILLVQVNNIHKIFVGYIKISLIRIWLCIMLYYTIKIIGDCQLWIHDFLPRSIFVNCISHCSNIAHYNVCIRWIFCRH